MTKATLKLSGLDCASCAMIIDDVLEEMDGVKTAKTNYIKEQVEVEFDENKTKLQEIKNLIEKAGYSAN